MAEVAPFESREAKLNAAIASEVASIRKGTPVALPPADAAIVQSYVRKIEGTYNVERAKTDTDNAIDLLYIAYNTTPQEEGEVRVAISVLMNRLITTQQESETTMRGAMRVANIIVTSLNTVFQGWRDVKATGDRAQIKSFIGEDLLDIATEIRDRALKVRDGLLKIATTYDGIIKDTVAATSKSEKTLSERLKEKAAVEKEISEANAKREQLEALVGDLKEEVAKFDKMARDYEARANTAEQRAFVMSIVRVGAQMISQAIPAIAMAAGGPAPMLASSALSALNGPAPSRPASEPADTGGKTADGAQTRTRISEQKAEIKKAEDKAAALKADIKNLEAEKAKISVKTEGAGDATSKEATSGSATQLAEYDRRIKAKADDLKAQDDARARLEETVNSLQASLGAVDKGLGKMSDEQQQASSLRDLQMRMLDKAETYEKERRNQSAELVKINALLKGKRTEEETIQLAIKSLNLSLSALKRTKEIVEEIAYFFKTFADFMEGIALDASDQIDSIEAVAGMATIAKYRYEHLVTSVDEFFIKQTAEWYAVATVSEKFQRSFADGWSKLNKLSGDYITGDRLAAYLEVASVKLSAIVAEREAAAQQKLASLDACRAQMRESA